MNLKAIFDRLPGPLRMPLAVLTVFCTYYLGARLGLSLSFKPDFIAAFWPPNAIVLAALLLSPTRAWGWFILAMVPAELAADLPTGVPLGTALAFVTADALEVLLAAALLKTFVRKPLLFNTLRQAVTYLLLAVLLAPLASGFLWSTYSVLLGGGETFWATWLTWFLGDALTHLTLTPFIVLWLAGDLPLRESRTVKRVLEGVALSCLLLAGALLSFGEWQVYGRELSALSYTPLPLLLWAALRFGPRGTFTAALFITLVSIWSASLGRGPFTSLSPWENAVDIQSYLLLALSPLILLSVIVEERRRALVAARESEDRYRSLVDTIPHGVQEIDRAGRITLANPAHHRMYGYEGQELIGRTIFELTRPEDRERLEGDLRHLLDREPSPRPWTGRDTRKDGNTLDVQFDWNYRRDTEGRVTGFISVLSDVTDRKKAEDDLRRSEEKFRLLFNSGSDAIFVHELTPAGMPGKFVEVNDVACSRLGYTREDLLRLSPQDIDLPVERSETSGVIEKILTGRGTIFERVHVTKDGRHIPVEINTSLFNVDGRELVFSVARDVTDRKRAEESLRKTKEDLEKQNFELKKLDLMKDGLIRDVSHELKTPVAKHRMQMEILRPAFRQHSLTEEEEKALRVMEESIHRQESVIRNLLDISRLESGGRQYRREPVDLAEILAEIRKDYQHAIESYGVEVAIDVPPLILSSDGEMLWHLFSNLVNNAIKFSAQGAAPRVRISADVREGEFDLCIDDNGVGIDADKLKMVFTRFYQASASSEGSGVGLSICKMIAEGLGGRIRVESDGAGKGAAAIVTLPCDGSAPSRTG